MPQREGICGLWGKFSDPSGRRGCFLELVEGGPQDRNPGVDSIGWRLGVSWRAGILWRTGSWYTVEPSAGVGGPSGAPAPPTDDSPPGC